MNFMSGLKAETNDGENNISVTENGALGYRTTGRALLDLNFAVSSLRTRPDMDVTGMFAAACAEDLDMAIVWMFMSRDPRGGMGERRLFRLCFRYLAREFPEKAVKLVPLIPEYGRWDDVVDLYFNVTNGAVRDALFNLISTQLNEDLVALRDNRPVSLCPKWLPSEGASSRITRAEARELQRRLGVTPRRYRIMLSSLRRRIDVVERKMSANRWGDINYEGVPSRANLNYRDAFLRHDTDRRNDFLASLKKDPSKIKASVLFPHEIVSSYNVHRWQHTNPDETLEALWNNLPNVFPGEAPNILVVADGSGSMFGTYGDRAPAPIDVANALAIYFAEKLPAQYHNKYITFSSRPQYVDLSGATTLLGKLEFALEHDECSSTDIHKVFQLILNTAVNNHLQQDALPETVLIISDMEFDAAAYIRSRPDETLFQTIRHEYADAGYQVPHLAFWNVCSRTGTIPVRENPLGVTLVSGFSPTVMRMVISGKLDPYDAMVDTLNDHRYDAVREALQ